MKRHTHTHERILCQSESQVQEHAASLADDCPNKLETHSEQTSGLERGTQSARKLPRQSLKVALSTHDENMNPPTSKNNMALATPEFTLNPIEIQSSSPTIQQSGHAGGIIVSKHKVEKMRKAYGSLDQVKKGKSRSTTRSSADRATSCCSPGSLMRERSNAACRS